MNPSEKHFELAVGLSKDALKALLIVNGGAATALIALMDKAQGGKDYTCAILLFAAGAVTTVIGTCFGYFSQLYYANHRFDTENKVDATRSYRLHQWCQGIAVFFVAVTIAFMVSGIVIASHTAR